MGPQLHELSASPDLLLLAGFMGASSESGHVRLYLDVSCATYVEIPRDLVVHRHKVPSTPSSTGGSYVWIPAAGWHRCQYGSTAPSAAPVDAPKPAPTA